LNPLSCEKTPLGLAERDAENALYERECSDFFRWAESDVKYRFVIDMASL
jgi:hypothetical protein